MNITYRKLSEAALLFAVFYLPGYLQQNAGFDNRLFLSPSFHFIYFISAVPQLLLMFYILSLTRDNFIDYFGLSFPSRKKNRIKETLRIMSSFFGILAVAIAVSSISTVFGADPYSPAETIISTPRSMLSLSSPLTYLLLFITCLVIGYHEELFFRVYLLREFALPQSSHEEETEYGGMSGGLSGGKRRFLVALAGSLLFASGHLYQGIGGYFATFAIGLFLSYRFLRNRSYHEVALAHSLYNFAAVLFLLHSSSALGP